MVRLRQQPFLQHKEHRQSHQRHVMLPALPLAHLVIAHAHMTLGILKGSFYEMTTSLQDG